jgi:hypothetical protein
VSFASEDCAAYGRTSNDDDNDDDGKWKLHFRETFQSMNFRELHRSEFAFSTAPDMAKGEGAHKSY